MWGGEQPGFSDLLPQDFLIRALAVGERGHILLSLLIMPIRFNKVCVGCPPSIFFSSIIF